MLTPKEGPFLQESLNIVRRAKHLSPFFTGASSKSDDTSGEEVDLDLGSEADEAQAGRYLFGLDNLEGLLQAVYATEEIPELPKDALAQDVPYRGLVKTQSKVLPFHQSLKDLILQELEDPQMRLVGPKSWNRRFPFKEEDMDKFLKVPKLDTALSQVTKRSDLSFKDIGSIKNVMDHKSEALLSRTWGANTSTMVPALAATCVARSADSWIERLNKHLSQGTKSEEVLDSLSVIGKAIAYLADAVVDSVRASAKTGTLINSARRAIWVKAWEGNLMFKAKLHGLLFKGSLLFSPGLHKLLFGSSEKGKLSFKPKKEKYKKKFFSWPLRAKPAKFLSQEGTL